MVFSTIVSRIVKTGYFKNAKAEQPSYLKDITTDLIGFRTVKIRGEDILLNDKTIYIRGISIHEKAPLREGRAWSEEDARQTLSWAKELGCNFVRLAHYPHNKPMLRLADEMHFAKHDKPRLR